MTGSSRGNIRRFTLVELMMVVAIIGAIAVLGVGVFNFTSYKVAETRTQGLVNKLDSVINFLYSKYNMYPQNTSGADGYLVLYFDAADPVAGLAKGGALENFPADYCKEFAKQVDLEKLINNYGQESGNSANLYLIADSWGRPLFYRTPGNVRTRGFDLCSAGQNGKYFNAEVPLILEELSSAKYHSLDDDKGEFKDVDKSFFSSELGDDVTNY